MPVGVLAEPEKLNVTQAFSKCWVWFGTVENVEAVVLDVCFVERSFSQCFKHHVLGRLAPFNVEDRSSPTIVDDTNEGLVLRQNHAICCAVETRASSNMICESSGLWGFCGRGTLIWCVAGAEGMGAVCFASILGAIQTPLALSSEPTVLLIY